MQNSIFFFVLPKKNENFEIFSPKIRIFELLKPFSSKKVKINQLFDLFFKN